MGFQEGDIVFAKASGYGFWPGQVMDIRKASVNVRKNHKQGCLLVAFFGDNSYGSFKDDPKQVVYFRDHLNQLKDQMNRKAFQKKKSLAQQFKLGIEQAQQILDTRDGIEPKTEHEVVDFLHDDFGRANTEFETWPPPALAPYEALKLDVNQMALWYRNCAKAPILMTQGVSETYHLLYRKVLHFHRLSNERTFLELAKNFNLDLDYVDVTQPLSKAEIQSHLGVQPAASQPPNEGAKSSEKSKPQTTHRKVGRPKGSTAAAEKAIKQERMESVGEEIKPAKRRLVKKESTDNLVMKEEPGSAVKSDTKGKKLDDKSQHLGAQPEQHVGLYNKSGNSEAEPDLGSINRKQFMQYLDQLELKWDVNQVPIQLRTLARNPLAMFDGKANVVQNFLGEGRLALLRYRDGYRFGRANRITLEQAFASKSRKLQQTYNRLLREEQDAMKEAANRRKDTGQYENEQEGQDDDQNVESKYFFISYASKVPSNDTFMDELIAFWKVTNIDPATLTVLGKRVDLFNLMMQVARHGGISAVKYTKQLKEVAKAVVPGLVNSSEVREAARQILVFYKSKLRPYQEHLAQGCAAYYRSVDGQSKRHQRTTQEQPPTIPQPATFAQQSRQYHQSEKQAAATLLQDIKPLQQPQQQALQTQQINPNSPRSAFRKQTKQVRTQADHPPPTSTQHKERPTSVRPHRVGYRPIAVDKKNRVLLRFKKPTKLPRQGQVIGLVRKCLEEGLGDDGGEWDEKVTLDHAQNTAIVGFKTGEIAAVVEEQLKDLAHKFLQVSEASVSIARVHPAYLAPSQAPKPRHTHGASKPNGPHYSHHQQRSTPAQPYQPQAGSYGHPQNNHKSSHYGPAPLPVAHVSNPGAVSNAPAYDPRQKRLQVQSNDGAGRGANQGQYVALGGGWQGGYAGGQVAGHQQGQQAQQPVVVGFQVVPQQAQQVMQPRYIEVGQGQQAQQTHGLQMGVQMQQVAPSAQVLNVQYVGQQQGQLQQQQQQQHISLAQQREQQQQQQDGQTDQGFSDLMKVLEEMAGQKPKDNQVQGGHGGVGGQGGVQRQGMGQDSNGSHFENEFLGILTEMGGGMPNME